MFLIYHSIYYILFYIVHYIICSYTVFYHIVLYTLFKKFLDLETDKSEKYKQPAWRANSTIVDVDREWSASFQRFFRLDFHYIEIRKDRTTKQKIFFISCLIAEVPSHEWKRQHESRVSSSLVDFCCWFSGWSFQELFFVKLGSKIIEVKWVAWGPRQNPVNNLFIGTVLLILSPRGSKDLKVQTAADMWTNNDSFLWKEPY